MHSNIVENLLPLAPEVYLFLAAVGMLLFCVYRQPRITGPLVLCAVMLLALAMLLVAFAPPGAVVAMNGMFVTDGFAAFSQLLILGGAALTLIISTPWLTEGRGKKFEYLLLVLLSTLGMMFMVSASHLLSLYMALEMSSLGLYVLASFQRNDARSTEAGIKYFMLGALASGILLFGISLVYGFTGALDFDALAQHFAAASEEGDGGVSRAVAVGMVLVIVGFCFKLAAVPFHMWTPDVYEGAPTPVTAFFSVAPKIAAFALFTRLMLHPFADLVEEWRQVVAFASFASMAVGALAALRQTNIKRLLAYSSISHAGFMLMGVAAGSEAGAQGVLVYLTVYLFTSIGAWGCVLLMRRDGEYVETLADLSGLARTHPWVAFVLAACMFSMAGIPPLAGFFGKLYVILPAIQAGLAPLAVAGLVASVISCYYYLRVVKFMVFDEPHAPLDRNLPLSLRLALGLSAAAVTLFFLSPGPLVTSARAAASFLSQ